MLIFEAKASLLLRFVLRLMRHEGWDYDIDIFDRCATANNPKDPWSGNNAIPDLLFSEFSQLEKRIKGFKILRYEHYECLIFLMSGGVNAKTPVLELPCWLLTAIDRLDRVLVRLFRSFFALGRKVVLQKVS